MKHVNALKSLNERGVVGSRRWCRRIEGEEHSRKLGSGEVDGPTFRRGQGPFFAFKADNEGLHN